MKKCFVPSPAVVIAIVALTVACISPATAAVKKLIGTKDLKNGAVTTAKIKKGAVTKDRLAEGALQPGPKGDVGPVGPQGPKGDTGPQGAKGDSGVSLFAQVRSDGTLIREGSSQEAVESGASKITSGTYIVSFNRPVANCAVVGSVAGSNPAIVSTHIVGDLAFVFVEDDTGVGVKRAFSIVLHCP